MTKLIVILILVAATYGGWRLYLYYDEIEHEDTEKKKQAAAAEITNGDQLPGLPSGYDTSLANAQRSGVNGMKSWLDTYGRNTHDPRKAWIELDYTVMLGRENPVEARKVYAEVKKRTPANSPVMPRIKRMERTYE